MRRLGTRGAKHAGVWVMALALVGRPGRAEEPRRAVSPPPLSAVSLGVPMGGQSLETAGAVAMDGRVWIGANDLARLLDATKFWRADVRKLVLRARGHRIQLTTDNPFVLVDDRTVRLPAAVRSMRGELQIPVALVDSLPHDSTMARLWFDSERRSVIQVPPSGLVGGPRWTVGDGVTRLSFALDRPEEVAVAGRARAHFLVHMGGMFVGAPPETLPEASLVRAVRSVPTAAGSGFELELSPRAQGFRVVREPEDHRVTLVFVDQAREDFESFAPEGPPGPRRLKTVVLDPGHGGADPGVTVQGVVEKDLTLSLAKLLRSEISRRLSAHVVMIRDDDRDLSMDQRAERANRAHADLVISLHFDGFASPGARGATAYCPPATFGSAPESRGSMPGSELAVLPWRDVAIRHAVLSRELAEDILSSLELKAQGPTRLREILPYALLGVNAPGLMLECATLTSDADRARVTSGTGLAALAAAIVDGIDAYQKHQ